MKYLKPLVITIVLFACQTAIFAQETPFGKKLAEDFWKALDEKRFVAAQTKLDSLKRREPNFDASKMEKALTDAKSKKDGERTASRDALQAKVKASNTLDSLFGRRSIQADSGDTLESVTAEIEKYSKMTDEVLTVNQSDIQGDLDQLSDGIKRSFAGADEKNAGLVKQAQQATKPEYAETAYYELLLRQSYLDNARKLLPDDAEIKKLYDGVTGSVNSLGTPEERAAKANKNLNAKIDAERLAKAAVKDAGLEKIFQNVANNQIQSRDLKYTLLKVVITYPDYGLVRHNITGIILGRYRWADIAYKDKDGKCKHIPFRIYQDYVGGSFSGNWRGDFDGFSVEMRCENVNK